MRVPTLQTITDLSSVLAKKPYNRDDVIARYKRLIRSLPRPNQYLLLYVLDLLSVFARKSDKNLMTAKSTPPPCSRLPLHADRDASDLAVIFRPALLSHPSHELSPTEHQLSQDVLEFLIEHQDWFMLDIAPPPSGTTRGAPPPGIEPVNMDINTDDIAGAWTGEENGTRRVQRRRTTSERPGGESVSSASRGILHKPRKHELNEPGRNTRSHEGRSR